MFSAHSCLSCPTTQANDGEATLSCSQEEFNEEPLLPHQIFQTPPPKSPLEVSKVPPATAKSLVDKETSDVIVDSEATCVSFPLHSSCETNPLVDKVHPVGEQTGDTSISEDDISPLDHRSLSRKPNSSRNVWPMSSFLDSRDLGSEVEYPLADRDEHHFAVTTPVYYHHKRYSEPGRTRLTQEILPPTFKRSHSFPQKSLSQFDSDSVSRLCTCMC